MLYSHAARVVLTFSLVFGQGCVLNVCRGQPSAYSPMDRQLVSVFVVASGAPEILVPSPHSPDPDVDPLRTTNRPGMAGHVGRLGLHQQAHDSSIDAVREADRPSSYLPVLPRSYSNISRHSSLSTSTGTSHRAGQFQGLLAFNSAHAFPSDIFE